MSNTQSNRSMKNNKMSRYFVHNLETGEKSTMIADSAEQAATRARDLRDSDLRESGVYREQIGDCACTAVNAQDPTDIATARWANRAPSFCARENAVQLGIKNS